MKKQENVSLDMTAKHADARFMTMADTMRDKLNAAYAPEALEVVDESAKHAGHSGARPGGETHFHVRIVSKAFEGVSRVERQRRVYATLADELKSRVHALSLTTLTPAEVWNEH
ncbi:MAG TPA: BolA family protein [Rhizomicrobium sp.]|jgi:BolA protein|nr:BolA family protein [Rhizomicrobium sp.]